MGGCRIFRIQGGGGCEKGEENYSRGVEIHVESMYNKSLLNFLEYVKHILSLEERFSLVVSINLIDLHKLSEGPCRPEIPFLCTGKDFYGQTLTFGPVPESTGV